MPAGSLAVQEASIAANLGVVVHKLVVLADIMPEDQCVSLQTFQVGVRPARVAEILITDSAVPAGPTERLLALVAQNFPLPSGLAPLIKCLIRPCELVSSRAERHLLLKGLYKRHRADSGDRDFKVGVSLFGVFKQISPVDTRRQQIFQFSDFTVKVCAVDYSVSIVDLSLVNPHEFVNPELKMVVVVEQHLRVLIGHRQQDKLAGNLSNTAQHAFQFGRANKPALPEALVEQDRFGTGTALPEQNA